MRRILFLLGGRVVRGARVGKRLGFPTANLDRREYSRKKLRVPFGVYAGTAEILDSNSSFPKGGARKAEDLNPSPPRASVLPLEKGEFYRAGIVIGPLDRRGLPKIEAHLLHFSGILYGKRVRLSLMRYLRPYKIFISKGALKEAITRDLEKVRATISL